MTEEQLEHADFLKRQQEEEEYLKWLKENEQTLLELETEAIRQSEQGYGPTEEDLAYMQVEIDKLNHFFNKTK
jgi:hypothetical protein